MIKKRRVKSRQLYRIIDANLNRLKEGIRVCEDIERYIFNNASNSKKLKNLRHKAKIKNHNKLLTSRDIINDPLKKTTKSEKNRTNIRDIQIANFKRATESCRVLEEFFKIIDTKKSEIFKNIRYKLYNLEKIVLID